MPKSPADPGSTPPIPPCTYLGAVGFNINGALTIGNNGAFAYFPVPPPPGGKYPTLAWVSGTIWNCDVFASGKHWGATLTLNCPGDNPHGSLTLFYADITGTYTGEYALTPTDLGQGTYLVQDPNEAPPSVSVTQS